MSENVKMSVVLDPYPEILECLDDLAKKLGTKEFKISRSGAARTCLKLGLQSFGYIFIQDLESGELGALLQATGHREEDPIPRWMRRTQGI